MSEWLDKPTHDGWWWLHDGLNPPSPRYVWWSTGKMGVHSLAPDCTINKVVNLAVCRWLAITPPAPPPKPLPKSREITLRASTYKREDGTGYAYKATCGALSMAHGHFESIDVLREHCRDTYGIEPEVSDE